MNMNFTMGNYKRTKRAYVPLKISISVKILSFVICKIYIPRNTIFKILKCKTSTPLSFLMGKR